MQAFVFSQKRRNRIDKCLAKILQLRFANSIYPCELSFGHRIIASHLAQRNIRENYVSGDASIVGQLLAQAPKSIEKGLIVIDTSEIPLPFFLAKLFPFWRHDWLYQVNWLPLFQRCQARVTQLQHIKLLRQLLQISLTHQLASDQSPFVLATVATDAVGRNLFVIPPADFFGVGTG